MDFIKIAICDCEKNIRAYLASLVRKQGVECEIAEYVSADEYLLDQTEHDLLFLDIELAGDGSGMDGMELARRIRGMELERQPVIIFVTGYEKYVYDAFDVWAFQYLLKPIDEQRFAEVFGRAAQIIFEAEQKKKMLVIQYGSENRAVPIQDINYIESRNHKVVLYLKDGELEYYEKIGRLEEELQGLDNENMIYRNVAAGYSAFMIHRIILLSVMLLFLSKKLEKGPLELHTKELCYLCLTPVVGVMFGNIIFRLLFTVKENVFFSLYDQYPAFIGLVPLIAALFYAGMVVTVASWREMVGLQEEKKKYFVEQQQLAAIRERIGEVEQFYDGIRRMKHEMKNHLTNIKGLAGSGSYEEMEQYIARMDESMDAFEMSVRTGNAVTDVIVNDKQKAAERMGIRFRSDFVYPASDRYNAYDIAIIVNNLLQNALEACGRMTSGEFL